jgi:hypothetical protein
MPVRFESLIFLHCIEKKKRNVGMTETTGTSGYASVGLFGRFRVRMLARTPINLTGKLRDNILNYFNTASFHILSTSLFTVIQSLEAICLVYVIEYPVECLTINKTVL